MSVEVLVILALGVLAGIYGVFRLEERRGRTGRPPSGPDADHSS